MYCSVRAERASDQNGFPAMPYKPDRRDKTINGRMITEGETLGKYPILPILDTPSALGPVECLVDLVNAAVASGAMGLDVRDYGLET